MPLERRHGVAVLNRARAHVDAGDLAAAQELLSQALGGLAPDPRKARPVEAEWVALQTGVLLSLGEPYAARGWAAYGHAAFLRLYGERDRRTQHALGLLAAVLARVGAHGQAAQEYQRLIELFTQTEGAQAERALAARADLATVEHTWGRCVTARLRLANVVAEHQHAHGSGHPVGIRMLARLAMMWRDCGEFDHAHALLSEARGRAAGLGPDIAELLATAARAPAELRHACGIEPAMASGEGTQATAQRDGTLAAHSDVTAHSDGTLAAHSDITAQAAAHRDSTVPMVARSDITAQAPAHRDSTVPMAARSDDTTLVAGGANVPMARGGDATASVVRPGIQERTVLIPIVLETPLQRPFSTVSYLPAHPELTAWEPLPPRPAVAGRVSRISPATLALIASIVGIVAIAVLLVLMISAVRPR